MYLRYGNLLQSQHDEVLEVSQALLKNSRVAVRKRSIVVISQLVTCCSQEVFLKLLDHVITRLSESDSVLTYKTYIQVMTDSRLVLHNDYAIVIFNGKVQ